MTKSQLSLKWLEVFQQIAHTGSVQMVANETGLSVSTVSQHLRSLEDHLGIALVNHKLRPMVLTPTGNNFLGNIEEALRLIRKAEIEAVSGNMIEVRSLRLGLLEDFDSEIAPELARILASGMKNCEFVHYTRPSHEILNLLRNGKIDVGVAAKPMDEVLNLVEYPMLRDPFVLATPAHHPGNPNDYLSEKSTLPFIRYSHEQVIGRQIEAQLRRLRITPPNRFEMESNQSIMGMVAEGGGWTITTPMNFIRAKRFHKEIELHPFPSKSFARYLSLFTREEYTENVANMIVRNLRGLIRLRAIEPIVTKFPWLQDSFTLLSEKDINPGS